MRCLVTLFNQKTLFLTAFTISSGAVSKLFPIVLWLEVLYMQHSKHNLLAEPIRHWHCFLTMYYLVPKDKWVFSLPSASERSARELLPARLPQGRKRHLLLWEVELGPSPITTSLFCRSTDLNQNIYGEQLKHNIYTFLLIFYMFFSFFFQI